MPISVFCPKCGKQLRAPDDAAGKQARCPQCQTVLTLPSAGQPEMPRVQAPEPAMAIGSAPPVPQPGDIPIASHAPPMPDAQQRACPACGQWIPVSARQCAYCQQFVDAGPQVGAANITQPGWGTVRAGLRTIFICFVVLFVCLLVILGLGVAIRAIAGRGAGPGIGLVILLPALVMFGAAIGIIVGQCMCCAVPAESGVKGFAITAAVCIIFSIICNVAAAAAPPISILGSLASLLGHIMFMLFIRGVAIHLGNQSLASSAIGFLIFGVIFVVCAFALGFVAGMSREPAIGILLIISMLVCGIVAVIWYLRLLTGAISTIDNLRAHGFPVMAR